MLKGMFSLTELRVCQVLRDSICDGIGLRTVIFFAGCGQDPKCPLCQNPSAWSKTSGKPISKEKLIQLATSTRYNQITFSGGDPLTFQFDNALEVAKELKMEFHKNIWLFTGYRYEFVENSEKLSQILPYIDVIVDGKFNYKLKDLSLKFRGSSNQRIIDVPQTLKNNRVIDITNKIK
jgi:anaerobic ribonucleoside-triphosphate reductase activating protein